MEKTQLGCLQFIIQQVTLNLLMLFQMVEQVVITWCQICATGRIKNNVKTKPFDSHDCCDCARVWSCVVILKGKNGVMRLNICVHPRAQSVGIELRQGGHNRQEKLSNETRTRFLGTKMTIWQLFKVEISKIAT